MRVPVSAKNFAAIAALVVAGATLTASAALAQCGPPEEDVPAVRESLLVTTTWLAAHLRDPDLVLLNVEHMRGMQRPGDMIPGSRLVDAMDFTVGSFDLPAVPVLDSLVESLGISNRSRVVLYGDPWVTGWMFLVMDYLGLGERTAVLDGGLPQWRAENRPVAGAGLAPARSSFTAHPRPEILADAGWIRAHQRDAGVALLDVRTPDEYTGASSGHGTAREGHIPGARLLEWNTMFERPAEVEAARGSRLLTPARIRALLRQSGVSPTDQPVVYCTVGMRASQSYFVLRWLGYRPRFYDGSWSDWSRRSELPIATGTARGNP